MRYSFNKLILKIILSISAGSLLYLSFSKYELWFLSLPAIVSLFVIKEGYFWLFTGFVFFFMSLRCSGIAAIEFGGVHPLVFYVLYTLFVVFLSLYQFYAPFKLWERFFRRHEWSLPLLYVFFEVLRSYFPFGGFPWLIIGSLSVYVPIIRDSLLYLNVYFQSLLILLSALFIAKRSLKPLFFLWVFFLSFGILAIYKKEESMQKAHRTKVALVQTAVPQQDKLSREAFAKYGDRILDLIEEAVDKGADIVVLPESALHFFYSEEDNDQNMRLRSLSFKTPILVGLIDLRDGLRPYNSIYLLANGTAVGHYDKIRLFPIGEYMPWPFGFLKEFFPAIAGIDYVPGNKKEPLEYGNMKIATPICFEVAYYDLVRDISKGANIIAVLTNDGWFKDSDCTHQHYLWARVRALENGKYLLWVNNTGDTGVVDHRGRVISKMPYMKRGVSLHEVWLID
ncbi:MAG: apolipoprotein N-acyltransferase [Aquificaceae bacterium]|nr:apolipoprotein N-acyltransferase [Aquificaceae bacterium]MDW8423619.1 apolipoprotein N-acyltransferase [Aquificaceae bacterium]